MKPSGFKVGDKWVCKTEYGCGEVWLDEIFKTGNCLEVWKWSAQYSDGSGWKGDWSSNKKFCVEEAGCALRGMGVPRSEIRFKKLKEVA